MRESPWTLPRVSVLCWALTFVQRDVAVSPRKNGGLGRVHRYMGKVRGRLRVPRME